MATGNMEKWCKEPTRHEGLLKKH